MAVDVDVGFVNIGVVGIEFVDVDGPTGNVVVVVFGCVLFKKFKIDTDEPVDVCK